MQQLRFGASYLKNLSTYLRHADFIDGDVERVRKYLVRHMTEMATAIIKTPDGGSAQMGQLAWQIRNERLANNNLCEPIMMQWLAFLTQEINKQDLEGDPWDTIFTDIDGFGTPLDIFVRWLCWHYLSLGQVGVLIEGPESTADNLSEAKARGERSYAAIFEPWLILKAERFKQMGPMRGKLSELILLIDSEDGTDNSRNMIVRRFWIEEQGQKYKSAIYKIKGHILDDTSGLSGPIGAQGKWAKDINVEMQGAELQGEFDEIPFILLGEGPREDSVLYSVVPKNREHLNKKSAKDSIDYYQAFQARGVLRYRPGRSKSVCREPSDVLPAR
jgi:hypothetical protein